jgi:TM2 domain-containing membrane protein YozV
MKNKNTAALLAITAGFVGAHRFYLGQTGLGLLYVFGTCGAWFFTFKIMLFIALIDGIRFLTMPPEEFDQKYNKGRKKQQPKEEYRPRQDHRHASGWEQMESSWNVNTDAKGYKKEGIAKYKTYDFKAAVQAFEKAIQHEPNDAPTHFNIACCYSMLEDKTLSFSYLAKAVANGMKNFEKILSHDGLAYLRIQSEWDNFVSNDYKMVPMHDALVPKNEPKLAPEPAADENPLDTLRRLYEQRQKGLIDEEQFAQQSKQLLQ